MAARRRRLLLVAAVLAAAAIEAAWLAPAALVDGRVAQLTGGALRLAATEGTAWRGRGVLVAGGTRLPVAWRVDGWPLLRGDLRIHLLSDDGSAGQPRADIALTGEHVVLRDVEAMVPASLVAAVTGPAAGWSVAGNVGITTAELEWAPTAIRGDARLHWRGARLVLADGIAPLDLGDVRAALTADGGRLAGPVSNEGGDIAVRGELTLRPNEDLRLSLALAPRHRVDATLARVLSAIGTAGADGWRVEWRMPLR